MVRPIRFILLATAAFFAGGSLSAIARPGADARIVLPIEERQINQIDHGIRNLLAGDWGDVAFLDKQLSTRLEDRGDLPGSNARIWASQGGDLYGITLRRAELVAAKDGAPPRALMLELAEVGPDARKLAERFTPDAEYTPPHPGASAAPGTWKVRKQGYTLYFSHKRDSPHVTGISLQLE